MTRYEMLIQSIAQTNALIEIVFFYSLAVALAYWLLGDLPRWSGAARRMLLGAVLGMEIFVIIYFGVMV